MQRTAHVMTLPMCRRHVPCPLIAACCCKLFVWEEPQLSSAAVSIVVDLARACEIQQCPRYYLRGDRPTIMQRNSNPWSLMQQRFQHAEGQKSEMKQAAHQPKSSNQSTAQLWYQPKRIPLYIAVAGGLIGAATFFWTKSATHPQVETSKHHR